MAEKTKGKTLVDNLAVLTGLPYEAVNRELLQVISAYGKDPQNISLEETRAILADYLQDILTSAKMEYERNFTE